MNDAIFIEDKKLRDTVVSRIEVLDKVKKLLLLPKLEMVTTQQVADYYEVDNHTVTVCYQRNKDEINSDGVAKVSAKNLLSQNVPVEKRQYSYVFDLGDRHTVIMSNASQNAYSARAVLRFGMLLRDSKIAKEVRTQLLNIIDKADEKVVVADIDEERQLQLDVGAAFATGDLQTFAEASLKLVAFKNRHIANLQANVTALTTGNLEWEARSSVNKAVKLIARKLDEHYALTWNRLYQELYSKWHINVKARGNKPYMNWVREDEWQYVQKSLSAMCMENDIDFSKICNKAKLGDDKYEK